MASTVDEITIEYIENGVTTVKQLDKVILTRGAWTTIVFKYQDWDKRKEEYGPEKYSFRRYQKKDGEYRSKSKFNISNKEQAEKIIQVLSGWTK
jgi:hypothetical protein